MGDLAEKQQKYKDELIIKISTYESFQYNWIAK